MKEMIKYHLNTNINNLWIQWYDKNKMLEWYNKTLKYKNVYSKCGEENLLYKIEKIIKLFNDNKDKDWNIWWIVVWKPEKERHIDIINYFIISLIFEALIYFWNRNIAQINIIWYTDIFSIENKLNFNINEIEILLIDLSILKYKKNLNDRIFYLNKVKELILKRNSFNRLTLLLFTDREDLNTDLEEELELKEFFGKKCINLI